MDAFLNEFNNDIYEPFSDVTDFTVGDLNSNYTETMNSLILDYYNNTEEYTNYYSNVIVNYYTNI